MSLTSQQFQELKRYKSSCQSTSAESEQTHIQSIQSIAHDIIKIIKTEENVFTLQFKKAFTRQKQKVNMSQKLQRNYCTERNSREKDQHHNDPELKNKYDSFTNDWMTVADFGGNHEVENQQKDSFFLDQQIQTSEYVPVRFQQYQNPEELLKQHKYQQNEVNDNNNQKNSKFVYKNTNKVKALPVKGNSNNTPHKQSPKPLKTPPSTPRLEHKLSESLISPVKNFKKHILQTVEQKRQIQENELAQFLNKPKIQLGKFYEQNQSHIPVYEKSKFLQTKKLKNFEAHTLQKLGTELSESTFKPVVNKNTDKLIDGKKFQERLEAYSSKKEDNQQKIIYEVLQDFPFKPKLNPNPLVESRIKKIWQEETNNEKSSEIIEEEEQDNSSDDTEERRKKNRAFFTLRLEEKQAQELFVD